MLPSFLFPPDPELQFHSLAGGHLVRAGEASPAGARPGVLWGVSPLPMCLCQVQDIWSTRIPLAGSPCGGGVLRESGKGVLADEML